MKPSQKRKCELFVYNLELAKKNLRSNNSALLCLMSEAYSSLLYVIDTKKILSHSYITDKRFAPKSTDELIAARMSLRDDFRIDRMYEIYVEIKKRLKNRCQECYIQYAAYILSEYCGDVDAARAAHLATKQLESIRQKGRKTQNCANDVTVSSLLSIYGPMKRYDIADDVAECIKELKERDVYAKAAKHIARVLAFGKGVASARCDRFIRLIDLLDERKAKIGNGKEAVSVAFASLIDIPDEELADSIAEVNNYLAQDKLLKSELKTAELAMYSVLIACGELILDIDDESLKLIKEATLADILSFGL